MSLKWKITAFTTLVILLVSILIAIIVYTTNYGFLVNAVTTNMENETQLIANNIQNALQEISSDMQVLSYTPPIQGIIRSTENAGNDPLEQSNLKLWKNRLATIFESMQNVNRNYTQIRYIGARDHGKEIVRTNQIDQKIYRTSTNALQSKGNTDYYKQGAQLSQGSILFSNINYNKERNKVSNPKILTMRAIKPIYTTNNTFFGLIIINVNIKRYLRETLLRSAKHQDVMVIDNYNNVFFFDKNNKSLTFIKHSDMVPKELLGTEQALKPGQLIAFLKKDPKKITIIAPVFSDLHKDQKVFSTIISATKSVALRMDNNRLLQNVLFWVILLCSIALLSIYLFTKRTMQPLSDMAKAISENIYSTNEPVKLPTDLQDEVGVLATAFERKAQLLHKLAMYDSLTGLPNRKNFMNQMDELIPLHSKNSKLMAIAFMDINKFKEVNDTYGHDGGNELLMQFSEKLQGALREDDFCGRLSGDEFTIAITNVDTATEFDDILNTYINQLNTTYSIQGNTLKVIIACGVARYPDDGLKIPDLLKSADKAMYQSKSIGDGRYVYAGTSPKSDPNTSF